MQLINVSDELMQLSKEMIETIEMEDREHNFKENKGFIERNVPAYKFKKNFVGLRVTDFQKVMVKGD